MTEATTPRKKWLLLAASVAIGLGLFFGPARAFYQRQKEQRSLALARHFFSKGDYSNASLSARQVLLQNPANIPACRIMAEIADRLQLPMALDWRRRLAELVPTAETKLQLAEAGLRCQSRPFPLTEQILQELSTTATNLAFYHVVAAELALNLRQLDAAGSQFASAVQLAPTNRIYQLNLAMVQLSSRNPATLAAARDRLNAFAADTNFAPNALRALIADRLTHDDAAAAQTLSEKLLRSPQAAMPDRLQHLTILKNNHRTDFPAQLNALQQFAATNAPDAAQMALWMLKNGLATDAGHWLTGLPKHLQNQAPVQLARATTIETERDWPGLRQFCAHGGWGELDFLRLAFLARAWAQLGEISVAKSHWHSAVDAAGNRLGALSSLLDLTARWQLADERLDLFWRLFQKFPRDQWIATALEQYCQTTGNTAGLRRIFQQQAVTFPASLEIKNNLAYLDLLLRTNQAEAETVAAKLHAQKPENPAFASTYAFALHLKGRDADGLAVMQKLSAAALAQPAIALHYGILLSATGNAAAAQPRLAIARSETGLLPEEKLLCNQAAGGQ